MCPGVVSPGGFAFSFVMVILVCWLVFCPERFEFSHFRECRNWVGEGESIRSPLFRRRVAFARWNRYASDCVSLVTGDFDCLKGLGFAAFFELSENREVAAPFDLLKDEAIFGEVW